MSDSDDTANHFDESFQGDSGEQSHPEGSQPTGGASPSTKKRGNYKIPLILGAIGLLLMISPFFYSAYVDATVGRGGPMMFRRVGPSCGPSIASLQPASLFSSSPFSRRSQRSYPACRAATTRSQCLAEPGSVRLPWPRPRREHPCPRSGTMDA